MMKDENKQTEELQEGESIFDAPTLSQDTALKKRRVNPRIRTLLIAVVAVVALAGVLLLIPLLPEDPDGSTSSTDSTDTPTYTLVDKSDKNAQTIVTSVNIKGEDTDYTITYDTEDKTYLLKGYEDLALYGYNVETLTDCATTFTANTQLSAASSLKDYGLEKPAATATVTYHDGSAATIRVGNKTPDESGYYVTVDGKNVYISDESMVSPFLMSDVEYVSTTLFSAPTAKEDDTDGTAVLKELHLTGSALEEPLSVRRIESGDATEFTYFAYVITAPYYRGVSEAASGEIANFTDLQASQAVVLHPTAKQKADFGFDKPGIVADITTAIETSGETSDEDEEAAVIHYNSVQSTITIGSTNEDGDYFVMADGIDAIFYVSHDTLAPIAERRYDNTVSNQLFLKDITTLSRIELTYEGTTHTYTFTHRPNAEEKDDMLTVTKDGKTYGTSDFRLLYQLVMSIERYGTTDKAPEGTPSLSVGVYLENGERHLAVDFFPATGSLSTARTSEGEVFTVKTSDVNYFIKQAANYAKGEPVLVKY